MYESENTARFGTVVHYCCESHANAIVAIQTHTFNFLHLTTYLFLQNLCIRFLHFENVLLHIYSIRENYGTVFKERALYLSHPF
jgi:hypothetical protein